MYNPATFKTPPMAMPDSREVEKEYCSTSEAAQRLGLSQGTVQQMLESGALEGWKTAGGHRRILRASVDAFLARAQAGPHPSAQRPGDELAIIVAEDDPVLRTLYQRSFANWGLPVRLMVTASGFDVLMEVGRRAPDLLIADLRMPGMDGFEMIRRVRDNPLAADMDVVVVSALSAEEIAAGGGLPADVTVYPKPVPLRELKGYVEALVARLRRRRRS